jgi:hypothetical protein
LAERGEGMNDESVKRNGTAMFFIVRMGMWWLRLLFG